MFPKQHGSLSLWRIDKKINPNPIFLKIVLDVDNNPQKLVYKNKILYEITAEEKKKYLAKLESEQRKKIEKTISKNFFRSINSDLIKMWINSPHTDIPIANSLKTLEYFTTNVVPVSWWGPYTDAGGYANMNREIVFRLHNHYVLPKIDICPTAPQVSALTHYYISKYASLDMSRFKNRPRIWSFTPIPHPHSSGKNIFFTMMETETLHPEFARICNVHANEVWVPSSHNKKVFQNSGVRLPIHVMPLGVDENLYDFKKKELGVIEGHVPFVTLLGKPFEQGINKFRFISLFGWSYRKGPDILIRSFVEEFKGEDDVVLIIMARHAGSPAPDHIAIIKNEAMRYARMVRKSNYPQVLLYPHVIPENSLPKMFRMGHAFVQFSRGEGFSLPQIEASACGLPIISCNNTGMSEYLREDNSFMVTTSEKEICSPEMHWITSYYHGQLFPKLGKAQINQARKHMRFVINHYDEALRKGKILTQEVAAKYTWKQATSRIAERIKDICREF